MKSGCDYSGSPSCLNLYPWVLGFEYLIVMPMIGFVLSWESWDELGVFVSYFWNVVNEFWELQLKIL